MGTDVGTFGEADVRLIASYCQMCTGVTRPRQVILIAMCTSDHGVTELKLCVTHFEEMVRAVRRELKDG